MSLHETAAAALETGPLCDSCLGRPFAALSHGLTNAERGRALRIVIEMEADRPHDPVEPTACWVCEGYSATADLLAEAVVAVLDPNDFETYQVGSRVPPLQEENDQLLRDEIGLDGDAGESLKRELNREVGRRVGAATGAEVDFERPDVLAVLDLTAFDPVEALSAGAVTEHAVDVQVNAAFVYGRYRKLEPDIPQTEWPCRECGGSGTQLGPNGEEACEHCGGLGKLYETSVEGLVAPPIRDAMDGTDATFHGAGREDVDARMLGTGRPFVVEVERPRHRRPDVAALERTINAAADGRVEVVGLRLATYEMVERVKELPASKRYRATVAFEAPVDPDALEEAIEALVGTTVEQYTPTRVDHRRASRTRTRTVYGAEATLEDATTATVEIHGEGGLYVKELIGGDDGRTEPSLAGLLGVDAVVTALDVLAVEGEDEPFEDEALFRDSPT